MSVSKLGQRRQFVIPKDIWEGLGLEVGALVEVNRVGGAVVITPKRPVDAEDVLTPEEEKIVCRGEEQIRRGDYVTLEKLEHGMERTSRTRRSLDYQTLLRKKLREMAGDPFRGDLVPLKGTKWQGWYRKRVGRYRIIFVPHQKERAIDVAAILPRGEKTYR